MKHYQVIGHPLSFCLTTPVLNGAFKELGIDAHFDTVDVLPEQLPDVMQRLKSGELQGLMVTRPHKTPSIDFLDEISPVAQAVQAVNLVYKKGEKWYGDNINWIGAVHSVKEVFPNLEGAQVLVLGAGGAARSAAYGFKQEGAEVSIWNRTGHRAKAAAEQLDLEWVEDMRMWDKKPQVVVNATSVSDQPRQSTMVPYPLWEGVQVALDAVYGKTSLFLEEAKAAQVPHALSGEVWFLKQTGPMFEALTGQSAPLELIARLTREANDIRH